MTSNAGCWRQRLYFLPIATVAVAINVVVLSLIDYSILKRSWTYFEADFFAVTMTIP